MVRKTHRRKTHIKRKTIRRTNRRKSIRHRKGGRVPFLNTTSVNIENRYNMGNGNMGNENMGNNSNSNGNNEEDIGELINNLQEIMDTIDIRQDKQVFIDRVLEFLPEARKIDKRRSGTDMEQQIVQRIADILTAYGSNKNYDTLLMNVRREYIPNNNNNNTMNFN